MKTINDFSNLEEFLNYRLENTQGVALVNSKESCTWNDLQSRIKNFIERYSSLNKNNNIPLVIYGHKEIDFVIAIYACLLHKIPFIPVDNIYPKSRLDYICDISKAKFIYHCQGSQFEKVTDDSIELSEKDLAYIIFTSGTTGQPKGVQIGREATFNLMKWMTSQLKLSSKTAFMNQAPFAFDLSMYEIFGNLAYGGKIVLSSREDLTNLSSWLDYIAKEQISTWVSTPSFAMQQVLNPKFNQENLPSIKEFLFCGEKLGKPVVNMLFQKFPDARIINTYGPTEATVATTYIDITPEMLLEQEELPVGREVLNAKLSIMNDEICISGIHVMRGYLNNEAKNNECLFINENGERTYRTGDYGFSKDGVFYVLGRKDEQIKFNGYRIELSEIEEKVLNLKALSFKNTAVVALKRNTGVVSRLICFYTANEKKADEEIKTYLSAVLPSYMIPSEFIHIENIPVTTNHKVDKKTLLEQYQNGNFK